MIQGVGGEGGAALTELQQRPHDPSHHHGDRDQRERHRSHPDQDHPPQKFVLGAAGVCGFCAAPKPFPGWIRPAQQREVILALNRDQPGALILLVSLHRGSHHLHRDGDMAKRWQHEAPIRQLDPQGGAHAGVIA